MFMNLQKHRVFRPMDDKNSFEKYPFIQEAIEETKKQGYIYFLWNDRVYDIQGYDVGLRKEHLL